jgi:uncharacterized protein (DUF983 family)
MNGADHFVSRAGRQLWRAVRLRCPRCGGGDFFQSWFRMVDRCPACGLATERGESGYGVGAYMFNMMATELVFVAALAAAIALTWPAPPWNWITVGGVLLMIGLPILFYPFSKTLFLGFDLLFNRDSGDAPPNQR